MSVSAEKPEVGREVETIRMVTGMETVIAWAEAIMDVIEDAINS